MRKLCAILAATLFIMLTPAHYAFALDERGTTDYNGYIVKLAPEAEKPSDGAFDEIYAPEGLYHSDSVPEIVSLVTDGAVEYIEPNYMISLAAASDPFYSLQWNMDLIEAEAIWERGNTTEGVKIAIVDSGINLTHEDFSGVSIVGGYNVLNSSSDVTDESGHGSAVAGIIAAKRNNGLGVAGIVDDVTLVPIKCFDESPETEASNVVYAIYVAIELYDCDVINLSLGMEEDLYSMREAIYRATSSGAIVVAAAGNISEEVPANQRFYPAAYSNVVAVGSVGPSGRVSSFSARNSTVNVSAPGESVYSVSYTNDHEYSLNSGTSFAAPHVSAIAAIAKGISPEINTAEFLELLQLCAVDMGSPGYDTSYGYGIVNIANFLELMKKDNSAPYLRSGYETVSRSIAYNGGFSPMTVDMTNWFSDPDNDEITYSVYSHTASGSISIDGSALTFTPSPADANKNVRIIISARDYQLESAEKAVLTVTLESNLSDVSSAAGFLDMPGHWSAVYVSYAVKNGLFGGVGGGLFAPDGQMDRGMFVTVLFRLDGGILSSGNAAGFTDLNDETAWYYDAALWASANGIVAGYEDGSFRPEIPVTREQMAVFMHRYAAALGLGVSDDGSDVLYGFNDSPTISDWAYSAMRWAVRAGLIGGRDPWTIAPSSGATRAECSVILTRFIESLF